MGVQVRPVSKSSSVVLHRRRSPAKTPPSSWRPNKTQLIPPECFHTKVFLYLAARAISLYLSLSLEQFLNALSRKQEIYPRECWVQRRIMCGATTLPHGGTIFMNEARENIQMQDNNNGTSRRVSYCTNFVRNEGRENMQREDNNNDINLDPCVHFSTGFYIGHFFSLGCTRFARILLGYVCSCLYPNTRKRPRPWSRTLRANAFSALELQHPIGTVFPFSRYLLSTWHLCSSAALHFATLSLCTPHFLHFTLPTRNKFGYIVLDYN